MIFDSLEIVVGYPKLTILLYNSMKDYQNIESEFQEKLKSFSFFDKLVFKKNFYSELEYFEKNFFSIFFISIFKTADLSSSKINKYGIIFHMIREIITAADNILDNEEKGPVILSGNGNPVLKNIILILLSNYVLLNNTDSNLSFIKIMETLDKIAAGESIAKLDKTTPYPSSNFIKNQIHRNIGGELLAIAFDIPIAEEIELKTLFTFFREAIILIGNSLQALDDMTDVIEDIEKGKANLLTSVIIENENISEFEILNNKNQLTTLYSKYYEMVINDSISQSLKGFELLESSGYPISQKSAKKILKMMFKLRGLEKEWLIYENKA